MSYPRYIVTRDQQPVVFFGVVQGKLWEVYHTANNTFYKQVAEGGMLSLCAIADRLNSVDEEAAQMKQADEKTVGIPTENGEQE
jgi:hypothetical protein